VRAPLAGRRDAARRLAGEVRRRVPGLGKGEPADGSSRSRSAWAFGPLDGVVEEEGDAVDRVDALDPAATEDPDAGAGREATAPTPEQAMARIDAARERLRASIEPPADDADDA
jgi:hypothetical protein